MAYKPTRKFVTEDGIAIDYELRQIAKQMPASGGGSGTITGVTAGTAISGGGTTGTVTVDFAPSELSAVTAANDDKIVIADQSDSDSPKTVTVASVVAHAPQGDITEVVAGTALTGGGTSGSVTLNVADVAVAQLADAAVQTSSESFADNDTSLMTSAAIQDKILSYGYITGVTNISGNAGTATALETARTIGGVSFDGTANIDLAGVNTAGNQNTSGNAATATALATARAINGVDFDGTAAITVTAAAGTLTGGTLNSGVTASSLTSVGTLSSLTVSGAFTPATVTASTVTVAADDLVLITDTSDSNNVKKVTAQSIANLGGGGGGGSPAGSDHQVQFNDNGSFGADANFTYDGAKVIAGTDFFASAKMGTGVSSFTVEPWNDATIALGAFGGIGSQGSYRTSLSWNWERGTDSAFHHLDINSYPQAGAVEIGNSGILFEFDDDYETTHTTHPAIRARITSAGLTLGSGTTGPILSEGSANTLRIDSGDGTVDIGCMNTGNTHFYTDREYIVFGTTPSGGSQGVDLVITDTALYPYTDNDLELGLSTRNWKRVWAEDGSSSAPAFCFGSDTNTGIYLKASGQLAISTNGVEHYFATNGLHLASGDWLRTYGTTGWYNGTYGGGWYMTDTTYIRTYSNRSIKVHGNIWLNAMATFTGSGYATARRQDSSGILKEYVSSERFKADITDLPLSEAVKILDSRPILFRDIEEHKEDPNSPIYAGLSAESLQEAGYEYPLKYDIDEEGNQTNIPRGIHHEHLVAPIILILRDMQERITYLEDNQCQCQKNTNSQ